MPGLLGADMRGLKIVILTPDAERFRGALTVAAAQAAAGGSAALFLQHDAVRLLQDMAAPRDEAHAAAGLPTLATLFEEALGLGVAISACQSGLALCGADISALDSRVTASGALHFLRDRDDGAQVLLV